MFTIAALMKKMRSILNICTLLIGMLLFWICSLMMQGISRVAVRVGFIFKILRIASEGWDLCTHQHVNKDVIELGLLATNKVKNSYWNERHYDHREASKRI